MHFRFIPLGKFCDYELFAERKLCIVILPDVGIILGVIVVFTDFEIATKLAERVDDLKAGEHYFVAGDHVVEGLAYPKACTESRLRQMAKYNWENITREEHTGRQVCSHGSRAVRNRGAGASKFS